MLLYVNRRPHEPMVSAQCAAAAATAAVAWAKPIPSWGPCDFCSNRSLGDNRRESPASATSGSESSAAAAAEAAAGLGAFAAAAHFAAAYETALERDPALGLSPAAQQPEPLAAFAASGLLRAGGGAPNPDSSPHPLLPALLATLERWVGPGADALAADFAAAAAAEALDGVATVAAALASRRGLADAKAAAAAAAEVLPYIGKAVDAMVRSFPFSQMPTSHSAC